MTAPTTPPTESLAELLLQLVDSLLEVAGDLDEVTDLSDDVGDDVDHRLDQVQQFVVAARVARTNLRLLLLQQRLEGIQESVDVVRLSHGSDAKPAAVSPSDDSAEHPDPYADPTISTTEHVEREVRRDRDEWDLSIEIARRLAQAAADWSSRANLGLSASVLAAKAEAWDEGYSHCFGQGPDDPAFSRLDNPYREATP